MALTAELQKVMQGPATNVLEAQPPNSNGVLFYFQPPL